MTKAIGVRFWIAVTGNTFDTIRHSPNGVGCSRRKVVIRVLDLNSIANAATRNRPYNES